jgi:hypothetical protein
MTPSITGFICLASDASCLVICASGIHLPTIYHSIDKSRGENRLPVIYPVFQVPALLRFPPILVYHSRFQIVCS